MNYLTLENILQKIEDNQAPYWLLYFDIGGQRANYPCDYNDSDQDKTQSVNEKIKNSCEKLRFVINNYKSQFNTGQKLFYITLKKDRKSNSEISRFEYIFYINGQKKQDTKQDQPNLSGYPVGMIPTEYLNQKIENLKNSLQTDFREKELKKKEEELQKKEQKIDKESTIVEKGLTKSLLKIYDALTGSNTTTTTRSITTETPPKQNSEKEIKKEAATEELASFIFDNFETEKEINTLADSIRKLVEKQKSKKTQNTKTK